MAVELLCDRAEDPDAAAAGVATTALMETGLDELAGPHRTWLGVTARFLVELRGLALPPDRIVLHLDEILDPRDEALRVALTRMIREGYQIAVTGGVELVDLLLELPGRPIVRVDVLAAGDRLDSTVRALEPFAGELIAGRIRDYDTLERCRALCFDGYEGPLVAA